MGSAASASAPTYNTALQAITDSFTGRDGRRGALNQIRTNEGLALPWQLREFHFDAATGRLVNAPLKDTPHRSFARDAARSRRPSAAARTTIFRKTS